MGEHTERDSADSVTDTLIAWHVLTWRKSTESTERERFSRLSDRHTDCMACLDLEKEHREREIQQTQ